MKSDFMKTLLRWLQGMGRKAKGSTPNCQPTYQVPDAEPERVEKSKAPDATLLPQTGIPPNPWTEVTSLTTLPRDIARDWMQTWDQEAGVSIAPLMALTKAWMQIPQAHPEWRDALRRQRALLRQAKFSRVDPSGTTPAAAFVRETLERCAVLVPALLQGKRWPAAMTLWQCRTELDQDGNLAAAKEPLASYLPSWEYYPRLTVERQMWRMYCSECDQRCGIDNMLHCASCAAWVCFQCFPSHQHFEPPPNPAGINTRVLKCRCGGTLRDIDDWLAALRLLNLLPPLDAGAPAEAQAPE